MPRSRRHDTGKIRRYSPELTLWEMNNPCWDDMQQQSEGLRRIRIRRRNQRRWPSERTLERLAMLNLVPAIVAFNERRPPSGAFNTFATHLFLSPIHSRDYSRRSYHGATRRHISQRASAPRSSRTSRSDVVKKRRNSGQRSTKTKCVSANTLQQPKPRNVTNVHPLALLQYNRVKVRDDCGTFL
jgi:hypothetical protein